MSENAEDRTQVSYEQENEQVRERDNCIHCGEPVLDRDYDWKFVQAGGCLEGPFCDRSCQLGWLAE